MEITANSQAILLLTSPLMLGKSKETSSPILKLSEYNRLARFLNESNLQPSDLFIHDRIVFLQESETGVAPERIRQLLSRGFLLSQALERWNARSIWLSTRADLTYPQRLRKRLGDLCPPVLFGCGDRDLLGNGGLAVIGSRNADETSVEYANAIGQLASKASCTIVSGGARGIDSSSMRGVLSGGGTAVGVLAQKLETAALERENRDLLMDGRLVLVSPYDPKSGFNVGNAMSRNKIIYALADAALVVQTEYGKGGTWSGAVEHLNRFRYPPLYVRQGVQGKLDGEGTSALIQKGAYPWPNPRTPDDLMRVISSDGNQIFEPAPTQPKLFSGYEAQPNFQTLAVQEKDPKTEEIPPSKALFQRVKELLSVLNYPLTDSRVAEYLGVQKSQAKAWLQQLDAEGTYKRTSNRPARYTKVN